MKAIRHKPTLSPSQCAHCFRIWYGGFCSGNESGQVIIPDGVVLCLKCWNALDNFLYSLLPDLYRSISNRADAHSHPVFYAEAQKWIADHQQKPCKLDNLYRGGGVPKWMQNAIEDGLVEPNDSTVYTIVSRGNAPIHVERSQDRSTLPPLKGVGAQW